MAARAEACGRRARRGGADRGEPSRQYDWIADVEAFRRQYAGTEAALRAEASSLIREGVGPSNSINSMPSCAATREPAAAAYALFWIT